MSHLRPLDRVVFAWFFQKEPLELTLRRCIYPRQADISLLVDHKSWIISYNWYYTLIHLFTGIFLFSISILS